VGLRANLASNGDLRMSRIPMVLPNTGLTMPSPVTPGLIVLHGNQLEQLRAAIFEWLRKNPLGPLEQDIFLVQSNGVAEWLKIAIAEEMGVCAATRIDLPGRFLWGVYRNMLGRDQVPGRSALDKSPLTWRLMRLIPELLAGPDFVPLRHFLADGDPERRLQLAERLADLIDQYQVYRADWLSDWAEGRDELRRAQGEVKPLADDQRWQAQLWRAILADISEESRELGRVNVHQKFLEAINGGVTPVSQLPRRVVLFGISALPQQTLQALSALAAHTQVLLAIPNPCQFYWGDIIEGRELFKAKYKRQQSRGGKDLAACPPEELHAYSHPLLAGWGRMGRDFVRLLDDVDNAEATRARFPSLRIDLFSEGDGSTLLAQVQASIRDLVPLADHPHSSLTSDDRSIEFHVAHSVQREVEVLHDQLLSMFAENNAKELRPRDVVVMVPDIETFFPSIRAVFGQYNRQDPRYIPFEIGDVKDRSINPLLVALDWLLRLPQQRCRQSEVRDLLDVPALASRFGLEEKDLPQLGQWIEGSGVRWGLDQHHRDGLGLGAAGEQNAWIFGIRRMLLGYASGDGATYSGIEPYSEVGGLDAALAGSLAQFVDTLVHWRKVLAESVSPATWGVRARDLMRAFFVSSDEADRLTLAQLEESLQRWLEACEDADFQEKVPLAVVREAWLGTIDEPTLNHRFVSGGVTFCSLMPMRAVPFRVVCLLGLNDADYPRRAQHVDFDLLAEPGMARPGDRSRRDDDRYLMLEALLAARDKLYISWVGRNVRDNSEQPASVLVSQLRDYLATGWDCNLAEMTTEHPLQPFSRRYFEAGGLVTYAREWRAAHSGMPLMEGDAVLPPFEVDPDFRLKLGELARFVKQPAKYFFRQRLGVVFTDDQVIGEDEEPFGLNALEEYYLADSLLDDVGAPELVTEVPVCLRERAKRLGREGVLPIGLVGQQWQKQLVNTLIPVRTAWLNLCRQFPHPADKLPVVFEHDGIRLDDWLDKMHSNDNDAVWLTQIASKVSTKKGEVRGEKLIDGWLRQLASAALGYHVTGYLVARDAIIKMAPLEQDEARKTLAALMTCWRDGISRPLPTACKTALAYVQGGDPREVYDGGFQISGEVEDICLARLWPNFEMLSAEADWTTCSTTLYGPLAAWLATQITMTLIEDGVEETTEVKEIQ
jgi:exodeoxyribonuclease V gamma subunit